MKKPGTARENMYRKLRKQVYDMDETTTTALFDELEKLGGFGVGPAIKRRLMKTKSFLGKRGRRTVMGASGRITRANKYLDSRSHAAVRRLRSL